MSHTRKSIYFIIFAAMFIWAADAAVDAMMLGDDYDRTPQQLLYLDVPATEVYERLCAMTVFLLLGGVVVWLIHQNYRTEVATGESSKRYEIFFEKNLSVMLLVDAETGNIADANRAACDFYGYDHNELRTKNIRDINGLSADDLKTRLAQASSGERNFFHFRHQLSNGDVRDVEVHTGPVIDQDRKRLLSVIHDVTERRHIQEELDRSRIRLLEAERIASLGHWEWDLSTDECVWSQQCARLFGYDPDTVGLTLDFFLQCVHPDDRGDVNAEIRRLTDAGGECTLSHQIIRPDGAVRHLDAQLKAFNDVDGRVIRVMGATVDVTERRIVEEQLRQSEQQYRTLIETVPHGIEQLDRDGTVEFCNARYYEMFGREPGMVIGRKIWDLVRDPDEAARLKTFIMQAAVDRPTPERYTSRVETPDGKVIDVEVAWDYRLDDDGVIGFIAVLSDCTERRRAEQAIMDYQQRLKELASQLSLTEERQRRQFASMLHDGIGQELFAVKTNLGLMQRLRGPNEREDLIAETQSLVDKTLKDARSLTFELSPPVLQDIGLGAALKWLAKHFEVTHRLRCRVETNAPEPCPLDEAQRSMLYHGARELLFNVVKHAQATEATIYLEWEDDEICIAVADNGVGFSMRKGEAPEDKRGGFGLFNIRERLTSAGGYVMRESTPGEGSKVSLIVPAAFEAVKET